MKEAAQPWHNPNIIDDLARPHYIDLEHHNWLHAVGTAKRTLVLGQWCLQRGADIDLSLIPSVGKYHDAGFHELPGRDYKFATKELYSADTYGRDMTDLGMPDELIKEGQAAIISTGLGVPCETTLARCLAQADLASAAASQLKMLRTARNLFLEDKQLAALGHPSVTGDSDSPQAFLEFCRGRCRTVLMAYNEEDVSLGPFDRSGPDGRSFFHQLLSGNIDFLASDRLIPFLNSFWPLITAPEDRPSLQT